MGQLVQLLGRCGASTQGFHLYEYAAQSAGEPRTEVRLVVPDGLSFIERVGYRYSVDKALRASAAAVYWRTVNGIHEQRLWMGQRLEERHRREPAHSFAGARRAAAVELAERETPVFPHYSLLAGWDRFSRL